MNNLKLKSMLEAYAKEREITKKIMTENFGREVPTGEWDNEPDFLEFVEEETNINCVILRGRFGQLNGYVQIPQKVISDLINKVDLKTYLEDKIEVHWGVSYCGNLLEEDCDYFVGFDCGHWNDYMPFISNIQGKDITYKNIEYVKNECKKVAMQLHNMAKEGEL